MLVHETSCEVVVTLIEDNELELVLPFEHLEVVEAKLAGFAARGAFHVHDLDDLFGKLPYIPLAAGFNQHAAAFGE